MTVDGKPSPDEDTPEAEPAAPQADVEAAEAAEPAEASDVGEADIAPEPTPEAQIDVLKAEKAELQDKLLRSIAEVDNIKKRSARELVDARVFAIERFAGDLLSVSDNLTRAMDALDADTRAALSEGGQSLMGGIEMTQKELHTVMARHGVTAIDAAPGAAFDPNLHQAVSQIRSEEAKDTVAQCFQSGWKIGDRVLRAAMVAVSTGPAAAAGEA
ncbi:MAG: nucleotide exchange factor GrpE [Pseudomonadota bacterium]